MLAAKDSWTEAGGPKLLHKLYQPIWRHVLKDLNLYQCRCVNLTNSCVIYVSLRINSKYFQDDNTSLIFAMQTL